MKILIIDVNCKKSSTGELCYGLYKYINKTGHTAALFYGRGEAVEETNIYKFGLDFETIIHAILTRVTGYTGRWSFISTRRLIQKIDEFKPDVIHLNELHAYFVNIKKLINYIKKREIPVVWTFHCEFMYTGKCGYAGLCDKWKTMCEDCPTVNEYPKSLFFDHTKEMFLEKKGLLSNLNALYITPSAFFSERVKESFLKKKQIEVINNGVDTDIYYPRNKGKIRAEFGIPNNKVIILSVAPQILSDRKGGHWIIELAKRQKNRNIEYLLVGAGDKIKRLSDNLTLVPLINDKNKLAEIYSEADCFVICSKHETFSMTCAEALCCGVPIAGFKCNAPETIFASPYAEFVDYGDLTDLELKINIQLHRNNKKISNYGMKEFSKEKMCSKYMRLYESMVALKDGGISMDYL